MFKKKKLKPDPEPDRSQKWKEIEWQRRSSLPGGNGNYRIVKFGSRSGGRDE